MQLFLVQHGEAKPETEDPERPLTKQGAAATERVAAWAAQSGVNVSHIRHSGKLRAQQTADIFAKHLNPEHGVIAVPGMKPNDDVSAVAEAINAENEAVMLVGHLPFLNRLASLLVTGDSDTAMVQFRNSGIVCLRREEGRWLLDWAMPPELVE